MLWLSPGATSFMATSFLSSADLTVPLLYLKTSILSQELPGPGVWTPAVLYTLGFPLSSTQTPQPAQHI